MVGNKVRAARQQKGMTLEDLARLTRISINVLEALEEDRIADLPPPVYVRGYLRSIAKELQCPHDEFSSPNLDRSSLIEDSSALRAARARPRTSFRRFTIYASALFLAAAAVVGILVRRSPSVGHTEVVEAHQPTTDVVAPTPAFAEEPDTTNAPPLPSQDQGSTPGEKHHVKILAKQKVSIRVRAEEGRWEEKTLVPDEQHDFVFSEQLDLLVRNAAAVEVEFNGKPIGSLGAEGRIRRLSFAAGSAKL